MNGLHYSIIPKPHKFYCGATLLEMMISFFVMGVGMMGVMGMQAQAMRFNQQANAHSQAMVLAHDIIESIRANDISPAAYQIAFDEAKTNVKDCALVSANCSQTELKNWDLKNWRQKVVQRLPRGRSAIDYDGKTLTVSIEYDFSANGNVHSESPSAERETYVLTAGL